MSASREQRTKLGQEMDVVIPRHISRVRRNVVALSENKFPPSHVPSATTQRDEGTWGFSIRLFGGGARATDASPFVRTARESALS